MIKDHVHFPVTLATTRLWHSKASHSLYMANKCVSHGCINHVKDTDTNSGHMGVST